MPIISAPHEFNEDHLYVDLSESLGIPLYLKCEGFNFSGSLKQKAAAEMVEAAEGAGVLTFGSILVESSSGNIGVALSVIAANKGYRFVCVTDSRCNVATQQLMKALGTEVHVITEPAADGGFLSARLAHVRSLCMSDRRYVWLNQYTNPNNWGAHYRSTAPDIARQFPALQVLFVGAGTTGTLMGCARWYREYQPTVSIVAVDSVGSAIFGGPEGPRLIPGIGAGIRPPLLDESIVDDIVLVPEAESIRACRQMASRGFLFGGSTGTVVAGASRWFAENPCGSRAPSAVAISADLGERYLSTVYDDAWLQNTYGLTAARISDAVAAR